MEFDKKGDKEPEFNSKDLEAEQDAMLASLSKSEYTSRLDATGSNRSSLAGSFHETESNSSRQSATSKKKVF
jgi:hypothetical protein